MKRYFYAGLIIIFLMAFALVGYGAWLNYSDENQIAKRMDSRVVQLTGAKATIRDFQPTIDMDAVRFSSDSMTDAIALVDGRILNWYVGKNDSVRKGDPLISLANESIPLKLQQATSAVRRVACAVCRIQALARLRGVVDFGNGVQCIPCKMLLGEVERGLAIRAAVGREHRGFGGGDAGECPAGVPWGLLLDRCHPTIVAQVIRRRQA